MNRYALFFWAILILLASHCNARRGRHPEQWLSAPVSATSRVKITSSLAEDSLQHTVIHRIVAHASIDTTRSSPRDLYSTAYRMEGHQYRFRFQIAGSVLIVSGEYSVPGLGGTDWKPVTRGRTPGTIGTPWEQMEVWTTGFADVRKEYSDH